MKDFEKGLVGLYDDLMIGPGYTFEDFKKSRYFCNQDGILIVDLEEKVYIDGRCYLACLFFRNGAIYMLSLICCDRKFSEIDEPKRKAFHDEILKGYGIEGKQEYSWGSISSDYDSRGNVSSINLVYN
ncbi:hypothetical protein D081_2407 [Anaerovibrio sp. JC8]|uniref:hypothetical protein n=1 Tax=Anaerovibrio sp. JC8 TaxID=1240085 RepID=UPI000A0C997A|nr:hypothetical protein [Anaerovibrio sp. JC8]ORT98733.1 hypothetical protein D081_2407 [Anaerovibrio sp. JC8]